MTDAAIKQMQLMRVLHIEQREEDKKRHYRFLLKLLAILHNRPLNALEQRLLALQIGLRTV